MTHSTPTHRPIDTALILGASSGIGRATALALAATGARVTAVARSTHRLAALRAESPEIETIVGDLTDAAFVEGLVRGKQPALTVLCAGVHPRSAPLLEHTWESFSDAWHTDTRAAFHLVRAALAAPLPAGSTIAIVSSGAALQGSHLSGGYAGAKRMSWWLASYAQQQADAAGAGLRFVTFLPKQLIAGTDIARQASVAYGAWLKITPEQHMGRWDVPLTPEKVASAIVDVASLRALPGASTIVVGGAVVEALP